MNTLNNDQLFVKYDIWQNEILKNDDLKRELDNANVEQSTQMLKFLTLFAMAAEESQIFTKILNPEKK